MNKFFKYLTSKSFFIQLILIAIFLGIVTFAVLFWLKVYTNHGQALEMPNYVEQNIVKAQEDAKEKSFEIIVNDSIHKVGIDGGLILDQNPKAGSKVKENRKVYVTITKFTADEIRFDDVRTLYGANYENKSSELSYLSINTKIKGTKFDPGESGHILEVWYNDQLIDSRSGRKSGIKIKKGDTLEFIVSKNEGAQLQVPDLRCQMLSAGRFIIEQTKLKVGDIKNKGEVISLETAFIVDQLPRPGTSIVMGENVHLIVASTAPEDCN